MWTYIKKMIENSIKKVLVYPFEVWMLLIYSLFELSFILLFWWSISSNFILPDGYVQGDMFVFSAMLMVSSGFQEIFFGINVLPYDINDGNLDNYIIKPKNMWIHYMLDTMNVPIILEKQIIGLIAFIVSVYCFAIDVNIVRTILAFVLLFFANFIFSLLELLISFTAFWLENIDNFRNLLYSVSDIKKYPMGFFAKRFQNFFLNIIPIGLVTYYPFEIVIGHINISVEIILRYLLILAVLMFLVRIISKNGLKMYASNN